MCEWCDARRSGDQGGRGGIGRREREEFLLKIEGFSETADSGTGFEDDKGINDRVKFMEADEFVLNWNKDKSCSWPILLIFLLVLVLLLLLGH